MSTSSSMSTSAGDAATGHDTLDAKSILQQLLEQGKGIELDKLKKILSTTSSSTVRGFLKRDAGFKTLDGRSTLQSREGVSPDRLARVLNRLRETVQGITPNDVGKSVSKALLPVIDDWIEAPEKGADVQDAHVKFTSGSGHVALVRLQLKRVTERLGDQAQVSYDVRFACIQGSMTPAPDFVLIRTSKSNFFSSKVREDLRPVERALTATDVENFFRIVLPNVVQHLDRALGLDDGQNDQSSLASGTSPVLQLLREEE